MTEPRPLTESERRARRERLAKIFGEGLPDQTRDDLDESGSAASGEDAKEAWLRRQVPPHHG